MTDTDKRTDTAPEPGSAPAVGIHNASLPLDLLRHCEIGHLVALGRRLGLTPNMIDGQAKTRPVRNPTAEQEAVWYALNARSEELAHYLIAVRPHPLGDLRVEQVIAAGGDPAADAASWRVTRMPHDTLIAFVVNIVNGWLHMVDTGLVRYDPTPVRRPLPPPAPARPAKRRRRKPQADRVVE